MMNLSNFSLLKEHSDHYEVAHPKGETIRVPKQGLSEKAHTLIKKMKKVQHFDDGGAVAPQADSVQDSPEQITADMEQQASAGVNPASPAPAAPAEQTPSAVPDMTQSLNTEKSAIRGGAAAEAQEGASQSKAQQDFIDNQGPTPTDIFKAHQDADQRLQQAFSNKTIDPQRYLHNMSTGSKIASAIAMLLGGFGAPAYGGRNLAGEQLDRAIDRDIEAQKSDQSKAMNLWKMNRENTQDEQQANLATKNQMLNVVKAKMLQATANAQGAIAKARIAPALAQIDQELGMNNYKRALLGAQSSGGVMETDPAQIVPFMVHDPAQQKEVYNEIGRAQNVSKNSAKILAAFDEAAKDATAIGTAGGLREPGSVMRLKQLLLPNFKQVDGTVRQAAMDETFNNTIPAGFDMHGKTAQKKQALIDWMHSETAAPIAKGNGIDLQKFRSTTADPAANLGNKEQSYLAWARANPQDPKAQLVLNKLGVK